MENTNEHAQGNEPLPEIKAAAKNGIFEPFLQMVPDTKAFLFQFLDGYPKPVEVFAPDGTTVFLNRKFMELVNMQDPGTGVGIYNVLTDPVCNDQMGMRDGIQRAFRGESVFVHDVAAPIEDLVVRGVTAEKPFEKSFMDFYLYPVKDHDKLLCVVFICDVKKLYHGRPDLARAKEYIDAHWRDDYDAEAAARHIGVGKTHLYDLFHEYTGMTPGDYYRHCKVDHIKEMLADTSLSIKEVFSACGDKSREAYTRMFKKVTGTTPTEYRKNLK